MKRQLIILGLVLITSILTYGQDYNIEWSKFNDIPSNSRFSGFLKNNDGLSIFYSKNETYYSHTYNSNLESIQQVEFTAPYNSKLVSSRFLRFIQTKNLEHFALYSEKSKDKKNWTLYASPIKNGKANEGKEIFSIQKQNAKHLTLSRETICRTNNDKSEVVYSFLNAVRESSKKWHYEIIVAVFDEEMNLKWSKIHKIENIDNYGRYLLQGKIDMNGEVHLLLKKIPIPTLKKTKKSKEKISLFTVYSLSKTDVKQHHILLKDELQPFTLNLQLPSNQKNKVAVNGVYSKNDKGDKGINIDGTFFMEFDTKTEKATYKLKAFEKEITAGLLTRPISSFLTDNGDYTVVLEDVSVTTNVGPAGSGQPKNTTYSRGNIYILYFNKDGEYIKKLKIEKQGKGLSSTPIITLGNKTYITYDSTKPKKTKLAVIDNQTMTIEHEQELNPVAKESILKSKKLSFAFPFNNSIIMYYDNGDKYVIGKLVE